MSGLRLDRLPARPRFLFLAVLVAALLPSVASAVGGPPPNCTLATIAAGSYAVTSLGLQTGGQAAALFLMTSDGKGNLSGAGAENLNGVFSSNVTATGTYTANSACWFTATIADSLGNLFNFAGAIDQNGYRLIGTSTDPGTQVQFSAYRLHSLSCTSATISGVYAWQVKSPLTPIGPSTATERWILTQVGSGTAAWVNNANGIISRGTATLTFAVNSDCTYTATAVNSDGTTGHFFGIGGLQLNDVAGVSMSTDSGWVSSATIYFTW